MEFRVPDLLTKKRDGEELSDEEIEFLVKAIVNQTMQDAQLGALLMAIFLKGMTEKEVVSLTKYMMTSGEVLEWPSAWKVVDKHSTGGVGDKISLPLAPALAACGVKVPMISGRGLGHTGGTLDKLESIPGYNIYMSRQEILQILETVGCCIVGQTSDIVPADKRMYAIRDVTSTVASLPLIVASIVSKKAASSPSCLVLDVKYGCGTFMPNKEKAEELAQAMVTTATGLNISTTALVTSMNVPIGRTIGNSLEIEETIACLRGEGPDDLEELVVCLGAEVLVGSGVASSMEEGKSMIHSTLHNGAALVKFSQMIQGQGVSKKVANDLCSNPAVLTHLSKSKWTTEIKAVKSGVITDMNALDLAVVSLELGAGRSKAGDSINHGVGIYLNKTVGEKVQTGDVWATVYHAAETLSDHHIKKCTHSIVIDDKITDFKVSSRVSARVTV